MKEKFIVEKNRLKYFFKIPFRKLNIDWMVYRVSLVMIPFIYAFPFFGKNISNIMQDLNNGECGVYSSIGLYCPGCGITRATILISQGHFIQSFLMHPFPMVALCIFTIYIIKNTLSIATDGKIKMIPFEPKLVLGPLLLIILNVIVRDLLLLKGIDTFDILQNNFHMKF